MGWGEGRALQVAKSLCLYHKPQCPRHNAPPSLYSLFEISNRIVGVEVTTHYQLRCTNFIPMWDSLILLFGLQDRSVSMEDDVTWWETMPQTIEMLAESSCVVIVVAIVIIVVVVIIISQQHSVTAILPIPVPHGSSDMIRGTFEYSAQCSTCRVKGTKVFVRMIRG